MVLSNLGVEASLFFPLYYSCSQYSNIQVKWKNVISVEKPPKFVLHFVKMEKYYESGLEVGK